jgi:hypothetical protein
VANSVIVTPLTHDPEMVTWLTDQGVAVEGLAAGVAPTPGLLVEILHELDWPCAPAEADGWWSANIGGRDGRYPPISEMDLHDGAMSFRLGALFGPWQVCRLVAAECGPQVAVESGSAWVTVVTSTSSYEDFHRAIARCEPREDGMDREWSQPISEEVKFRNAISELHAVRLEGTEVTLEQSLEYAMTGRIGCGGEAMSVGHAIQAHRWHPMSKRQRSREELRIQALVDRLREHLASTAVPIPELVWAFGQAEGVRPDLLLLADRLRDDPEAAEALDMAEVFLRSAPADEAR